MPCPTTLLDFSPPPPTPRDGTVVGAAGPPDEVTEDILLRLDAGADVARAAAACRAHLRIVRDRRFLLRLRSLRPPPVIGFIASSVRDYRLRLHRPEAPHGSAAAARAAVARAGDFTFSFLPTADAAVFTNWSLHDVRDGRVLLSRRRRLAAGACFLDLAVCDPLHRRYVLIPAIPDELVLKRYSAEMGSEALFAAAAAAAREDEQFQVIYNWMSPYKIDTFVFSSGTGKWRAATSFSLLPSRLIHDPRGMVRYHAGTCFYWVHDHSGHMLVLDELEMNFSLLGLPFHCRQIQPQWMAVFDAGEDGLGVIVIRLGALELEVYCRKNNGGGAEEWRRHKVIPFPEPGCSSFYIVAAAEGCLMLEGRSRCCKSSQFFTLDLKTFLAERWFIVSSAHGIHHAHLYANYPPLLSLPSI